MVISKEDGKGAASDTLKEHPWRASLMKRSGAGILLQAEYYEQWRKREWRGMGFEERTNHWKVAGTSRHH